MAGQCPYERPFQMTNFARPRCGPRLAFPRIVRMALFAVVLASCTDPFGTRVEFGSPPELAGLSIGPPGLRDGVLSLAPGDTVRSRYEDRHGGTLVYEFVFQGFDD